MDRLKWAERAQWTECKRTAHTKKEQVFSKEDIKELVTFVVHNIYT